MTGQSVIRYWEGDLLKTDDSLPLAHCISNDKKLTGGFAKQIEAVYQVRKQLLNHPHSKIGHVITTGVRRTILHLITKQRAEDQPEVGHLMLALMTLREELLLRKIKVLGIPLLAAGIDKIKWEKTRDAIEHLFKGDGISFWVYYLPQTQAVRSIEVSPQTQAVQSIEVEHHDLGLGALEDVNFHSFFDQSLSALGSADPEPGPSTKLPTVKVIKFYKREGDKILVKSEPNGSLNIGEVSSGDGEVGSDTHISDKTGEVVGSDIRISDMRGEVDELPVMSDKSLHNGKFLLAVSDEGDRYCHCSQCREIQLENFVMIFKDLKIEERDRLHQKIRLLEQKRKGVYSCESERSGSMGTVHGQIKAVFVPEKHATFRSDPNIFGRFEFPLNIEGEITRACELDTGAAGTFLSMNIFNQLSAETRALIPKVTDSLPFDDFGDHPIKTVGAVTLLFYMGETAFSHKVHLLEKDDVFLLGGDAVISKKIGWYWPSQQDDPTFNPYCFVTIGYVDNILGTQVVKFDLDSKHPIFCTKETHIKPGIGHTKCEVSLIHPSHDTQDVRMTTTFDEKVVLVEPAKELIDFGVGMDEQIAQPSKGTFNVALQSPTMSELTVFTGQLVGHISIAPEGVIFGKDDISSVSEGILELDPDVCYRRLVSKIVSKIQAAEIEIVKIPPPDVLKVVLESGKSKKIVKTDKEGIVLSHKSEDAEQGLYRAFLDILNQLKTKRYQQFTLDLSDWQNDDLTWPQVHSILAQIFRKQQIKIFFMPPVVKIDPVLKWSEYSSRYRETEQPEEQPPPEQPPPEPPPPEPPPPETPPTQHEENKHQKINPVKKIWQDTETMSESSKGDFCKKWGGHYFKCKHSWINLLSFQVGEVPKEGVLHLCQVTKH